MTQIAYMTVGVRFDTSGLGTGLQDQLTASGVKGGAAVEKTLGETLTRVGTSMGNLGRQLSLGLSLPLAALGKSATDAFVGFDTAMTQVIALSGVERTTVDAWRGDVEQLGAQYGVTATDAAQALYFITSSGVDAADAMGVLEVALKGAATGLGSAKTVADVITSAMNQYGAANISAAQAADILTVAVREGKGEADAMAGALSRTIPLAGALGVSFGEVSGLMSSLTLSGVSADEAATQINALLSSFTKLPPKAQTALKSLTGFTYETVQSDLKTKGLTRTLSEIYHALGDNEDALARIFPNIRALRGITGLFGEKEAQTLDIINKTTHAVGAQKDALEETANSKAFQLQQAQADFSVAMTNIGEAITPVRTKFTQFGAVVLGVFTALPAPVKGAVAAFGGLAVAAGPVLYMGSSVVRLSGEVQKLIEKSDRLSNLGAAFDRGAIASNKFAQGFGLAVVGVTAGVIVFQTLNNLLNANIDSINQLGAAANKKTDQAGGFQDLLDQYNNANEGLRQAGDQADALQREFEGEGVFAPLDLGLEKDRREVEALGRQFESTRSHASDLISVTLALAAKFNFNRDAVARWVAEQARLGTTFATTEDAYKAFDAALKAGDPGLVAARNAAAATAKTFQGLQTIVSETSDAFFASIKAKDAYRDAIDKISDASDRVTKAQDAYRKAVNDLTKAQHKIAAADRAVAAAADKVTEAREKQVEAEKTLEALLKGRTPEEKLDLRSARLAVRQAQEAVRDAEDPLSREAAQIQLARSRLDLKAEKGAHERNLTAARKDLADATKGVEDAEQSQQDAVDAAADARTAVQDALDRQNQALRDITKAQEDLAQAQLDAVPSAIAFSGAQDTINSMFEAGTAKGAEFRQFLLELKGLYPELAGAIDSYIGKFDTLRDANRNALRVADPSFAAGALNAAAASPSLQQRASGGPLDRGDLSTVNERGVPELWSAGGKQYLLPTTAGNVVPLKPANIEVKGGDGGVHVGEINVYGQTDPVPTAYELRRQLRSKRDFAGRR